MDLVSLNLKDYSERNVLRLTVQTNTVPVIKGSINHHFIILANADAESYIQDINPEVISSDQKLMLDVFVRGCQKDKEICSLMKMDYLQLVIKTEEC